MNRREKFRLDPASVNNILFIRLRRIGDIIMTTPALAALRRACPNAAITYVVDEPYRELVEGHPALQRIIRLPRKLSAAEFLRRIKPLRRTKYDIVIDLHSGPRASLLTGFCRAGLKVGYKIKYRHVFYDVKVPRKPPSGHVHSVENHINAIKAAGIPVSSIPPLSMAPESDAEKTKVRAFMTQFGLRDRAFLVLHIGAGNRFREWGTENLIEFIDILDERVSFPVVLVGASEDLTSAETILRGCRKPPFSLVGRLGLRELRHLIDLSRIFVGPDSGPMHIAATTSTPIAAYFGPTLPAHFAPWKAKHVVIEKDIPCRPCRQTACVTNDFRCIRGITAEEVFKACLPFLRAPSSPSPSTQGI